MAGFCRNAKTSIKKEFLKLFENNMYESMFAMGMTKDYILKIFYFIEKI